MLNSKKQKCIGLMVLGEKTQKEIAGDLHITEQTICNWKRDGEFLTAYNEALRESMQGAAAKACKTVISLLQARNEQVRLSAAKDILDRAGFKPDENITFAPYQPVIFTGEDELED